MAQAIQLVLADEAAEKLDQKVRFGAPYWAKNLDQEIVEVTVPDQAMENPEAVATMLEADIYRSHNLQRLHRQP